MPLGEIERVFKQLTQLCVNTYPSDLYIHCLASGAAAAGAAVVKVVADLRRGSGRGKGREAAREGEGRAGETIGQGHCD